MIKIIKKDNKYYRQEIMENEITLKELKEEMDMTLEHKENRMAEETKNFDDRISEIQEQIDEIKKLK